MIHAAPSQMTPLVPAHLVGTRAALFFLWGCKTVRPLPVEAPRAAAPRAAAIEAAAIEAAAAQVQSLERQSLERQSLERVRAALQSDVFVFAAAG